MKIEEKHPILRWKPELFIENAIGQIGEQDKWFTIKKDIQGASQAMSPPIVNIDICEHRRIKGVFWEKLELNHVKIFVLLV